jgi:glycosyltransferase involved in cell wall biosynthesis
MVSSVTVVVPCYNYGRYLRQCVNSILAQDIDLYIDIIDDASTDDSESVGSALAAEDSRVRYQRHANNLGHIATFNEGLERAIGTYTLLLSADDMLSPGALPRAVDVLDRYPDVALLYGEVLQFQDMPPEFSSSSPELRIWESMKFITQCCKEVWNPISSPSAVVRTAIQKSVGGYIPDLMHSGDREMWLRLATRGHVAELKGVVQAYYRVHESNMHKQWFHDFLVNDREFRATYEAFFTNSAEFIENRDELRHQCSRKLAERGIWWGYQKLRHKQFRGTFECLRYAASVWDERPEDKMGAWNMINAVKPLSYAVHERHKRRVRKQEEHSVAT